MKSEKEINQMIMQMQEVTIAIVKNPLGAGFTPQQAGGVAANLCYAIAGLIWAAGDARPVGEIANEVVNQVIGANKIDGQATGQTNRRKH